MMDEILRVIFGSYTFIQLFGFVWFFCIGFLIYGLNETDGRDKKSRNTPVKWNWKFWFKDNWKRYLLTILTTYIMFMFYKELVGHDFTNYEAMLLGIVGDGVGAMGKRRISKVRGDREALMNELDENEKG